MGTMDKSGPAKTDQGFYLIDASFPTLAIQKDVAALHPAHGDAVFNGGPGSKWEVTQLAREIKMIEGVLSVGIFAGENGEQVAARGGTVGGQKPIAAYFGMPDGSVVVRRADAELLQAKEGGTVDL